MRRATVVLIALASCAPPPAAQVSPVDVAGSFEKTWAAVIDIFATQNLPISTIDKSSGLIVASSIAIPGSDGDNWAKCSSSPLNMTFANRADFNILVRGVGTGSTVRATARWTHVSRDGSGNCSTTGVWERGLMLRIKQAVEGAP